MNPPRIIVVGGGAAGCFAAITAAESAPEAEVTILEKSAQFLGKVRISGGGRCNVTHRPLEPREFAARYPRGGPALIGPLRRFGPADTAAWFEGRGVALKTEADGRVFPVTDSSETIIGCLMQAARDAGVTLRTHAGVESARRGEGGGFELALAGGERIACDRLLLATGGCRAAAAGALAASLGHALEPPVPSLFTFHVATPWLRDLAGVSVPDVEVSVPELRLTERGPLLVTHWGLSGPAILRLSAWGARALHGLDYRFRLRVNWLAGRSLEDAARDLEGRRGGQGARLVVNAPPPPLSARLWEQLVLAAGVPRDTRWASLTRDGRRRLAERLVRSEFTVAGKTLNQDEFVTCGGVRLAEVSFKTMESRLCPGLHLAGELLDVDGLTGGFNFQAAWTTGWIAGRAMAGAVA